MLRKNLHYVSVRNLSNYVRNLKIGDSVVITKTITKSDLNEFAKLSGDTNPIHFAEGDNKAIVHGAFLNSLVSGIIGTKLPGPGTLVVCQNLNFPNKCFVNDTITVKVDLIEVRKLIKVKFECEVKDKDKIVMYGDAKLIFNK